MTKTPCRCAAAPALLSMLALRLTAAAEAGVAPSGTRWLDDGFATSDAAKEAQPHWVTPS